MNVSKTIVVSLISVCFILIIILLQTLKYKRKKQLSKGFSILFILLITYILCLLLQIFCVNKFNVNPMNFEYLIYAVGVFFPVAFWFIAMIYAKTKITFSKRYLLLFIIPVITILLIWTNNMHHLFFIQYSPIATQNEFGIWFKVYTIYTYLLFFIAFFILIKYSIKNSGFFSKPAILIFLGAAIPIVTNLLGLSGIIPMSEYITPISLGFTAIFFYLALFRFNVLQNSPIALQTIVDRISDSYVILNDDYEITDYNETFLKTFKIKNPRFN